MKLVKNENTPRFLTEYANSKIKKIESNDLMQCIYKSEKIMDIVRIHSNVSKGLITIDEAMRCISEV